MVAVASLSLDVEKAVSSTYSAAAKAPAGLCCPTPRTDPRLLAAVPAEVLERDYGCGDPTRATRATSRRDAAPPAEAWRHADGDVSTLVLPTSGG